MRKQLSQLKEFDSAFGNYSNDNPTINIPEHIRQLRYKLLREELAEVVDAMENGTMPEVAKELADLLYVLLGTVRALGLDNQFEEVFDEVHRSNMSKLGSDGKPILREDGKVLKSENYFKADIERVLA